MSLEIKVPAVGESITEVTVARWLKNDGDHVKMDEIICELESDKATFELNAEKNGTLKTNAKEGDTIAVGEVICWIEEGEKQEDGSGEMEVIALVTKESKPKAEKVVAAVAAKQEAAILEKPIIQSSNNTRPERREKMSNLRRTVSKRLVAVKNETAMLTTFNEVDMRPIMDLRSKYKDMFKEKHGVGLGFMSFFTKAVCEALKEWPSVNAQINGEEIIYHDYCDISIAVSAPKGLVVPVIRNAESLRLDGIEKAVAELAVKARENKLSIEEMTGGTFTITNGGVFGSLMSTPILNAPQSAILGMHNIVERPVAIAGQVVIRPMMYVALSYDHRIIDGRESVSFLVRVKQLLEDPARMLLAV
ncbi:MAG: dihydrolipoyllysine-residue succinyltransferase [Flavobacteriaceae bacterium]|nr:dihydrolipoyllysine-residue succinyltransferase [Flavobacteriaceae bacterium]